MIVDEAHRMSRATNPTRASATGWANCSETAPTISCCSPPPHKGDPRNFTLFLQLLDEDAYADVKSIEEAMERRQAPFYLRRVKEAMVHFPERQPDGAWAARPVFTKRITNTASFQIEAAELSLYEDITRFREEAERPR